MKPNFKELSEIYKRALEEIVKTQGKVCNEYELCTHVACESSAKSWFIADRALKDGKAWKEAS